MINFNEDFDAEWDKNNRRLLHFILDDADDTLLTTILYKKH
jgi:hypothetical protein